MFFITLIAAPLYAESAGPNILLLVAEDMSSHVREFGDTVAVTPNLDQLAKEGVRFTNVFTTASTCGPSRASLMTGMHPNAIGAQHMRTSDYTGGGYKAVPPAYVKAFPELLRRAGYYTFTDTKLDYQFSGTFAGSGPFTIWSDEGRKTSWKNRSTGQPFFGMLNFMVTHESGIFPPLGDWPHSGFHLFMQLYHQFADYDIGEGPVKPTEIDVPPYYPDTPTVREDMARLYNNIYQMDQQVGNIIAALKAQGLLESTIIIWTSDHGDGLPRAKRSLFDSGLKVPMIIRWPERFRPKTFKENGFDERLISFVDLAPTILAMANVAAPDSMHGINFLPASHKRQRIFAAQDRIDEVYDRQRAVRDERYKYIRSWYPDLAVGNHSAFRDNMRMMRELWVLLENRELNEQQRRWFEPAGKEQLYDTLNDPFELSNLARKDQFQAQLQRMRNYLDDWQLSTADWGKQPESAMVKSFQIGGGVPITAQPTIIARNGYVYIDCQTAHASVAYKTDNGRWRLYSKAIKVEAGQHIETKAVRYGWEESEEVSLIVPEV